VASLGDLDGDGEVEVAIGASRDDTAGCSDCGSVTIVSLGTDGLPTSAVLIAEGTNGGPEAASAMKESYFGTAVAAIGDVDGDGVMDLAVGAPEDNAGAVWVFLLNADGTAKSNSKISSQSSFFANTEILQHGDAFGMSVAGAGDRNEDGVPDLLVGAQDDTDGAFKLGSFYIIFLAADGSASGHKKLSVTTPGVELGLQANASLGGGIANIGDLNGDGIDEIAVAATNATAEEGGNESGVIFTFFMDKDNEIESHVRIASQEGGFTATLDANSKFGFGLSSAGDLNHDGVPDLIAPALNSDAACSGCGGVYVLFLGQEGAVVSHSFITAGQGGLDASVAENMGGFGTGSSITADLDGDGLPELLVGDHRYTADGTPDAGGVYTLFLAPGDLCN